jgi:hypothetical protein
MNKIIWVLITVSFLISSCKPIDFLLAPASNCLAASSMPAAGAAENCGK